VGSVGNPKLYPLLLTSRVHGSPTRSTFFSSCIFFVLSCLCSLQFSCDFFLVSVMGVHQALLSCSLAVATRMQYAVASLSILFVLFRSVVSESRVLRSSAHAVFDLTMCGSKRSNPSCSSCRPYKGRSASCECGRQNGNLRRLVEVTGSPHGLMASINEQLAMLIRSR
jgi:hypothetical protein